MVPRGDLGLADFGKPLQVGGAPLGRRQGRITAAQAGKYRPFSIGGSGLPRLQCG